MSKPSQSKPSLSAAIVALLAMLLAALMGLLAARFWLSEKQYGLSGPTHIAAGPQGIFVYTSDDVLHLAADGRLLEVAGRDRTGLLDAPIDLRFLEDGRLLIAEQRPARVRVCDVPAWVCHDAVPSVDEFIDRQFKILPLDDGWLLSDAAGDALYRLEPANGELVEALPAKTLAGPNGLAFDNDGNPWVADTDHRRIVALLPGDDGTFTTGREHSAMNELTIGERHYPMMIERGRDGRFWVTQGDEFGDAHADLVIYDPDDGAEAVVDLPEGAYATDIVVLDDAVLVTDMDGFAIHRVTASGSLAGAFGDEALGRRFEHYREQRKRYGRLSLATLLGLVVVAALLIVTAIRVTPRERRWSKPREVIEVTGSDARIPDIQGVRWLERNAKTRWMTTWFERLFYVLFGLLCLVALLIYVTSTLQTWPEVPGGMSGADQLGVVLMLACLGVAAFIPLIHFGAGMLRRRLGTDGRSLLVELEDGRRMTLRPEHLYWNDRVVLYREFTFPIQAGRGRQLYADGEVQTWLAPLLGRAKKINEWQVLKHQWKHRDRVIMTATAALVLLSIVLLLIKIFGAETGVA